MGSNSCGETQKLIRCRLTNEDEFTSIRFVECEIFKLWQYAMHHKHGLAVSDMSLCLWVNSHDYRQNKNVLMRFGETESVSKIVVSVFDDRSGFSQTSSRFTPEQDATKVREILLSHIPLDILKRDSAEIHTYPGKSIGMIEVSSLDEIILGLSRFGGDEIGGLQSEIAALKERVAEQEGLLKQAGHKSTYADLDVQTEMLFERSQNELIASAKSAGPPAKQILRGG